MSSTSAIVSTWSFSRAGVTQAAKTLQSTANALDAVEAGISAVEHDPSVTSVGYGGLPNANGVLQLDAALMTNRSQQGSVVCLEGFRAAIPIARLVLSHSPHPMLSGSGAATFAQRHGCTPLPSDSLLTPHACSRFADFKAGHPAPRQHHAVPPDGMGHTDTVGMLALDNAGLLVAGCATSGMQFKQDGRVGDSPVFGSGLYADAPAAAVATGDGDDMLRFCLSFLIVERVRLGDSVSQACGVAINRLRDKDTRTQAAVIALDGRGHVGAAATHEGFSYMTWDPDDGVQCAGVSGEASVKWKHNCV